MSSPDRGELLINLWYQRQYPYASKQCFCILVFFRGQIAFETKIYSLNGWMVEVEMDSESKVKRTWLPLLDYLYNTCRYLQCLIALYVWQSLRQAPK